MGKIATVTKVRFVNERTSEQYGTFYNYEVEFDNGDKGQYSSKSREQNKFVELQKAEYEIEERNGFKKIKPVVSQNGQAHGGYSGKRAIDPKQEKFRQNLILAQSTMKLVNDLCIHGKKQWGEFQQTADHLMQMQIELALKYQNHDPI